MSILDMQRVSRQSDSFIWHCGPHPCEHESIVRGVTTRRFSLVHDQWAFSLVVDPRGTELFYFHRTWKLPDDVVRKLLVEESGLVVDDMFAPCDLLRRDCGLSHRLQNENFHAKHGSRDDQLVQPFTFWQELEAEALRWIRRELRARDGERAVC